MTEVKISREVAVAAFEQFCEAARLDLELPRDENDSKGLALQREQFIYHVMTGTITVDEEGWPTVNTQSENHPAIRFNTRAKGRVYLAMDKAKKNHDAAKLYAQMANTTGIAVAHLAKLEITDLEVVRLVHDLFCP